MHAQTRITICCALLLCAAAVPNGVPASADAKPHESEGVRLAKAALAPYETARSYKGTRTTTWKSLSADSEVTRNVCLLARVDEHGAIERLAATATIWGDSNGKDVTGKEDSEIVFDGNTLWTYWPKKARFRRSSDRPASLSVVLGLPPVSADWVVLPHRKDDMPDEKALRATVNEEQWTLVIDASDGKLLRIERMGGKGAKRWQSTNILHDTAFNKDDEVPNDRFAFVQPVGAVEETGPSAPAASQLLTSER